MKKQLSIILALVMLVSMSISASAAVQYYTPESAGPMVYTVDFTKPLSVQGAAQVSGNKLVLSAGGSATFDIYFNCDTEDIELEYEGAGSGSVTVETETNSYSIEVDPKSSSSALEASERKGSHTITVSSSCKVTLTSLGFHKAKIDGIGPYNNIAIAYDDYDSAMQTAVAVDPSKVAIKVNGAFRYYDYTNTSIAPKNIDGRIYLPIHAFARAFQLYYEDYPDLNYAYLADDNIVVYQRDDTTYMLKNDAKYNFGKFAIYLDGITWVPFRQMAELFGETVVWRDGIAIADERVRANAIISDEDIFSSLVKDFAQFDVSTVARNNTYYVSQAAYASDSNNGSENFPFRTIQHAADVAKAGDTVIIRGGTYRETVTVRNDGTATQPIIFKAAEGEDVTISAFEKVSGFANYKGDIYQTIIPKSLGYDRNFIIMNDEILREGRYPNTDTSTVNAPHPGYTWKENIMRATFGDIRMPVEQNISKDYTYAVGNDLNQTEKDYWKGGTFVTMTGEGWTLCYALITGSKYGRIDIAHNGQGGYAINNYYLSKKENDWGYITHHLNTVDMPGEWYVDDNSNTLYLIPPEGVDPSTLEVEVKQRQVVVDMTDRKFVQFHNINTRGGGLTMAGNTEMDVLDGGTHKYISQIDWSAAHATHDGRYIDRPSRWKAKVDAPELGEVGFYARGINNAFVNTHIAYSAVAGIYLTGTYGYVENNFIESASYMGTYPGAVTMEGIHTSDVTEKMGGHTVVANTLVGSGRANLYLSRGKAYETGGDMMLPYIACDLSFNRLAMGSTAARDTGSFYSYGTTVGNDVIHTHLHHNVVYDLGTETNHSSMNALIYHDGYACFYDTYSNLTFQTVPGYVSNDIFQHVAIQDYRNYVEKWGNVSAGTVPEGMAGLKINDYPYGKKFDVGSTRDGHARIMENCDRVNEANIAYTSDAELSGGAVLTDDGLIDMPTPEATVTYKNVKCYDEGTELSIYYASDIYQYSKDNVPYFTFEFIQNGQVVATREEGVYAHAVRMEDRERTVLYLKPEMAGTYDVRIKVSKDYVRPSKLMFTPLDFAAKAAASDYPLDGDTITLGSWDHCLDCGDKGPRTQVYLESARVLAKTNFTIHDTNTHQLVYENRVFTQDTSVLSMRFATAGGYANTIVDIYVDDRTEPVASFDCMDYRQPESMDWFATILTLKMNRVIPAGVHTVYVFYRGYQHPRSDLGYDYNRDYGVTDSYWLSFHNGETYTTTSPKLSEIAE